MTTRLAHVGKSHRLLAPRIAYLIGTRAPDGEPNVIPVSNVTSVSTEPQHVLLAVHKRWKTYQNLLVSDGFTLSVPMVEDLAGVWRLGARYSRFPVADRRAKLEASGLAFDLGESPHGPILSSGVGWMECRTIARIDLGGDHGSFVGQVERASFNSDVLDEDGVPHAGLHPLMQVTGNRFTTSGDVRTIQYFEDA